jgi:membrane protein
MYDAILGAGVFVFLFMAGRSFYWVYLHYAEKDLAKSYGNFYTLIVAILWIYYLICSFFFSASVAYANQSLRKQKVEPLPDLPVGE